MPGALAEGGEFYTQWRAVMIPTAVERGNEAFLCLLAAGYERGWRRKNYAVLAVT